MKRYIKSTDDVELYESFLEGGTTYPGSELKRAYSKFESMLDELENQGISVEDPGFPAVIMDELQYHGAYDLYDAATCKVICDAYNRTLSNVESMRVSPDADFEEVTFKDGEKVYFFDRGVFGQGIKDADTGELYWF